MSRALGAPFFFACAAAAAAAAAAVAAILRRRPSFPAASVARDRRPLRLVFCGKAEREVELARALKGKGRCLKLSGEGEEEEHEMEVVLQSEVGPIDELSFGAHQYMEALKASSFGRFLVWAPRISSTHDLVSRNFSELPLGTVCIADIQSKGRGRSKNVWESPLGCLLFSFTLEMHDGHKLPLLQYVVSLAVTEAVKELCETKGLPRLDVRIKWPNDLYLNGLKVGGILCTSTYRLKKFNVCAGVGLNVDNEKPTTCLNAVLQERGFVSCQLKREEILSTFFNKFEKLFDVFSNQGFQVLEELYCRTWLHSGQKVVIEEKHEGQLLEEVEVTIQGLTSSGYLLATDGDNKRFELHPDGNSFDFFKGLVRRKLGQ